jgi:hypothetical protein
MATMVGVDLDPLRAYHTLWGLPVDRAARGVALGIWLPRFLDLFESLDVNATFFVVGEDLRRSLDEGDAGADAIVRAIASGHEIASHSWAHDYSMIDWSAEAIMRDLKRADRVLRAVGASPIGFRAPGYTHDRRLLSQVAALGYRYDSSKLPSPLYYATKRAVIAWLRVRGRSSASRTDGAAAFFGPRRPHLLAELGLWEVPISVSAFSRAPMMGTFLLAGPSVISSALRAEASAMRDLHLELHAIDLADADQDPIDPELATRQPELKVPLETRLERLRTLLEARGGGTSIARGLRLDRTARRVG